MKPAYSATYKSIHGHTVKVRKNKPKHCKAVKQICIKCTKVVINKNDAHYTSKVCKVCAIQISLQE